MRVARFASRELLVASLLNVPPWEDELPLGSQVAGMHYDRIEVRLILADYLDSRVQDWMRTALFTRSTSCADLHVTITVVA